MRPEIMWFGEQMEKKLQVHDGKGGWDTCELYWLLKRLQDEVAELKTEIDLLNCGMINYQEAINEAADVANFAMMIADNVRSIRGEK